MSSPRVYPFVATARHRIRTGLCAAALLTCAACTPPPDTPTDKPAEPRATQMRDAMQAPVDSAREAQAAIDPDAQRQRRAIEDAGG